jgi:phospholipase C
MSKGRPSRPRTWIAAPVLSALLLATGCQGSHSPTATRDTAVNPNLRAYVTESILFSVLTYNAASHRLLPWHVHADTSEGITATPDGRTIYIAETGTFDVLAVDTTTGTGHRIQVGPFPHDIAASPDGTAVYATVTGSDSGDSRTLAVIDTRSGRVTHSITTGSRPNRIALTRAGDRAYVSCATGIAIIDTRRNKRIGWIADPYGPQDLAVTADGHSLYVTEPRHDTIVVIDTGTHKILRRIPLSGQPWAIAVTQETVYVTRLNADAVSTIDIRTGRVTKNITTGRQPQTIAITPEGSRAWIGNAGSHDITVINTHRDIRMTTISNTRFKNVGGAPLAITFATPPSTPAK